MKDNYQNDSILNNGLTQCIDIMRNIKSILERRNSKREAEIANDVLNGLIDVRYACAECGEMKKEAFMVHDELWNKVIKEKNVYICLDCFEERLGRKIRNEDLTDCAMNDITFGEERK